MESLEIQLTLWAFLTLVWILGLVCALLQDILPRTYGILIFAITGAFIGIISSFLASNYTPLEKINIKNVQEGNSVIIKNAGEYIILPIEVFNKEEKYNGIKGFIIDNDNIFTKKEKE